MGVAFLFFFGLPTLVLFGLCMAQILEGASNKREKERKITLMKEHPEIAREIWQSIAAQDDHHRAKMDALNNTVKKAFDEAVTPKPRKPSAAFKIGLAFARKLAK
jgi:hypothetical protein